MDLKVTAGKIMKHPSYYRQLLNNLISTSKSVQIVKIIIHGGAFSSCLIKNNIRNQTINKCAKCRNHGKLVSVLDVVTLFEKTHTKDKVNEFEAFQHNSYITTTSPIHG